jgi:Protein kinase domain/AAA ATPase domain
MRASPADPAGRCIADRYVVEEELGRGGMATVHRVHDRQTDRHVALKRSSTRDPAKLLSYGLLLEREYHTLAQLAHPHIIEVYDYGMDGNVPYYTMELLQGIDLNDAERLPFAKACLIIHDIASGLALLHSRGLVHRDVSTRNVAWTRNERAKLIDFGAMTGVGVAKDVVGTPAFIAPEVLQLQALDGRADIFSLGALAYRLFTGRHAYAARRFSELRDVWRSKPVAPKTLNPEVPPEISALIMRMLMLDRGARVQTVAEIVEQLGAHAGIEHEDVSEISKAYLTTPTVVGRDGALLVARRHVLSLVRGEGGLLLVRGVSGSGRSRMLDVCVLEAKLVGAVVVRADARDASSGEWGVAKAIGTQLISAFSQHAFEAARLSRRELGNLFEELQPSDPTTMTSYPAERSVLIRELRDWVLSLAKVQRIVIVVDDFESVDEASAAWLIALAHKASRQPLMLAIAVTDDKARPLPPALEMLCDPSNIIELPRLDFVHTDQLIRSVFGDVANVSLCASRIHALADGNPRATMELAQHLVDSGRARYEGGNWILPQTLDDSDLPSNMASSLAARVNQLTPTALRVAEAIALTVDDAIAVTHYLEVLGDLDHKQLFRALDELVARRVVHTEAERAFFTQRGFIVILEDGIAPERRRALHARIAALLERNAADVFRCVHHLLHAGDDRHAIELLGRLDLSSQVPPAELLALALARAAAIDVPARLLHRLRMALLIAAPYAMDYQSFRRVAPVVMERLEHDSGLTRYRQLSSLPESERLTQAIAQANAAYNQAPEKERVFTPFEAILELARLTGALTSMALPIFELELLEQLPPLEPFYPLSPTLAILAEFVQGARHWLQGRTNRSREIYLKLLARIDEPDEGGFEPAQHERLHLGLHQLLGLYKAVYGIESAEEHAELLESSRALRVNAWRIRAHLQLAIGNAAEANRCLRRAELLQIQDGLKERYLNAMTGTELLLRSRLGDLMGVKSQLPTLAHLAAQFPNWRPVELLGRSRYHELQGELETALDHAVKGVALARPGMHSFFSALAASHVRILHGLQRLEEARRTALRYLNDCEQNDLGAPDLPLRAALVLADSGDCEQAVRVLAPLIEEGEQLGRVGLALGGIYEARARIAIAANDSTAFRTYAERCAREYQKSRNPALGLELAALFDRARERGLMPSEAAKDIGESLRPVPVETEIDTLHSRFEECLDRAERARCAITLLLENAFSNRGYLYGIGPAGSVQLLAALPEPPNDTGVLHWVERCARALLREAQSAELPGADVRTQTAEDDAAVQTETQPGEERTLTGSPAEAEANPYEYTDLDGLSLEAIPIRHGLGRNAGVIGFLVVETAPGHHVYIPASLAAGVAGELLERGDASLLMLQKVMGDE